MTLVEVCAGAALLGTLLTAVVVAESRFAVQSRRAGLRVEACAVVDEILDEWWSAPESFPKEGEGDVSGRAGWRWRLSGVENEAASELGAHVVRLEVFAPGAERGKPSARVELIRPEEEKDEATGTDAR